MLILLLNLSLTLRFSFCSSATLTSLLAARSFANPACLAASLALKCNSALSRSLISATRLEPFCSITSPTTTIIQKIAEITSSQCQKLSLKWSLRVASLITISTPSPATPIITNHTPISAKNLACASSVVSGEGIDKFYERLDREFNIPIAVCFIALREFDQSGQGESRCSFFCRTVSRRRVLRLILFHEFDFLLGKAFCPV